MKNVFERPGDARGGLKTPRGVFCFCLTSLGLAFLALFAPVFAGAVPAPTFSPDPAGTYSSPVNVTISADCGATAGATFAMTCDDGSTNCSTNCPYFALGQNGSVSACGSTVCTITKDATFQAYNNNTGESSGFKDYNVNPPTCSGGPNNQGTCSAGECCSAFSGGSCGSCPAGSIT